MNLLFLYGRIVEGQFFEKCKQISKEFKIPFESTSNELIIKHIENFSKTDDENYSYFNGYFSKILNKKIILPKPIQDNVELPNHGLIEKGIYVRLSFDFSNISLQKNEIEHLKLEFEQLYKKKLGLNFLDGRIIYPDNMELEKKYIKFFGVDAEKPPRHIMKTLVEMKENGTFEDKMKTIEKNYSSIKQKVEKSTGIKLSKDHPLFDIDFEKNREE
ncbi:MAG: hypothetical protein CBB97_21090 [Candidatus Endolissoclinum sp. TMED37]|nr:MAG: hypothetical protein CBB97_21090 [Candidatus Endolissoclinum sp. TMED37]